MPKKPPKKQPKPTTDNYHLPARTESEQLEGLTEELVDTWKTLRAFLMGLGKQEVRTSHRSIMFARKTCYAFARPKKKHIELNVFLPESLDSEFIKKVQAVSKTKFVHVLHLVHSDQVDSPLTDWLREAYSNSA